MENGRNNKTTTDTVENKGRVYYTTENKISCYKCLIGGKKCIISIDRWSIGGKSISTSQIGSVDWKDTKFLNKETSWGVAGIGVGIFEISDPLFSTWFGILLLSVGILFVLKGIYRGRCEFYVKSLDGKNLVTLRSNDINEIISLCTISKDCLEEVQKGIDVEWSTRQTSEKVD